MGGEGDSELNLQETPEFTFGISYRPNLNEILTFVPNASYRLGLIWPKIDKTYK
jgi:hypothetical protein